MSAMLTQLFHLTIKYEQDLTTALTKNNFTSAEREQLNKLQHHVRSIIAYAVHSRCFKAAPRVPLPTREGLSQATYNRQVRQRNWENTKLAMLPWRDFYDYNYHQRGKRGYTYQLLVDDTKLCSIFLAQLKELNPDKITSTHTDGRFFRQVMANKVKALNDKEMQVAVQKFFREALVPQVLHITEQSMARSDFLFPFHRTDYVKACEARRDYYFASEAGDRTYRYPQEVRANINCAALQQLPAVEIKSDRKINCAQPLSFSFERISTQSFADLPAVTKAVNETVQGMNDYRADLDQVGEAARKR